MNMNIIFSIMSKIGLKYGPKTLATGWVECIRSGILHSKILVSNIPCVQKCTYTAQ